MIGRPPLKAAVERDENGTGQLTKSDDVERGDLLCFLVTHSSSINLALAIGYEPTTRRKLLGCGWRRTVQNAADLSGRSSQGCRLRLNKKCEANMFRWVSMVVTCGVLGFMGGAFASHFPGLSSDWAAWVQAGGSLVAIAIAIWIPARERERDRAEKRNADIEETRRFSEVIKLIATDAVGALSSAEKYIRNYDSEFLFSHPTDRLDDALFALRNALDYPASPQVVKAVLRIRQQITLTIKDLRLRNGDEDAEVTVIARKNVERRLKRAKNSLLTLDDISNGARVEFERSHSLQRRKEFVANPPAPIE